MSTYKNLIGKDVNFLTTDLDNAQAEGQIWYNSTSNVFKNLIVSEAFSSAAPIGTARYTLGVAGTQTAGLLFAGDTFPGPSALTEEYNGYGWTNGGSMSTARRSVGGFGTQTAAVVTGGNPGPSVTTATEEYDGSSWTGGGAIGTGRRNIGSAGILTAGLAIGGYTGTAQSTSVEHYNGTSWTAGGAFPSGVSSNSGMGTQTAALSVGGNPGQQSINFKYDGSSWTALNPTNTVRANTQSGGDSALAVIMGGYAPSKTTATETWDGTNWSTSSATLATAKTQMGTGPVGSSIASFGAGGYTAPGITSGTEEFNRSLNVITAAAWSSGGNLNSGGQNGGGAGIQTAALAFGGDNVRQAPGTTEEYDGSSWTTSGVLNTKRYNNHGFGSQIAAVGLGGISYPPLVSHNVTEEYNGSSWTNVTAQPAFSYQNGTAGSLTAGVVFGGNGTAPGESTITTTNEYDGTNWASGGALGNARSSTTQGGAGTQTACLAAGSRAGSPINPSALVEEYNGTSWTAGGALNAAKTMGGMAGIQTNALLYGGGPGAPLNVSSERYDGTSWVTSASMANARNSCMPATQATADTALAVGSEVAPTYAQTEEFTAESTALNIKTITTG